jgi:RND family efflux transporter MFP subunit
MVIKHRWCVNSKTIWLISRLMYCVTTFAAGLTMLFAGLLVGLSAPVQAQTTADVAVHLRGVVMPAQKIKFSFAQSGMITQIAGGGSIVEAGEVIGKLDQSKVRSQLKQSKAQYLSAKSELASVKHSRDKSARLVAEDILSEVALIEADFTVEVAKQKLIVAKAQLELAQTTLDECIVKAPFKGAVVAKNANQGEWVNAGDPFMEFVNLKALSLSIDIPPDMTLGLYNNLTTDVIDKGRVVGSARVKTIFPVIDPASGLRRIVWQITPIKGILLTGRYVSLAVWDRTGSDGSVLRGEPTAEGGK